MESEVVKRRGRKRKNREVLNVAVDTDGKKRTRSKALVGKYVRKEFHGSGIYLGKITSYDSGLYRVDYEDGDCEDLDSTELRHVLIEDEESGLTGEWLDRKKKLDEVVMSKGEKPNDVAQVETHVGNYDVEVPLLSDVSNAVADVGGNEADDEGRDADGGMSSDSCVDDLEEENVREFEVPVVPPPELPPSSGNIGVPEEYVSYLLSVYSFLRSFSIQLFLFPFGLDEFVGALNSLVANTLLDSVHVALMRMLRHHFEKLSSDGSELASKCLRGMDWSLLDTLTWPIYLVHYLRVMGYAKGPEWRGFYSHVLERDYYTLSVSRKLIVLQILCDDVLDVEGVRAEMDMREESEVGIDSESGAVVTPVTGPRRVHPRYSKTSACKDQDAMEIIGTTNGIKSSFNSSSASSNIGAYDVVSTIDQDSNGDECRLCGMDGTLLCCDGCPSSYHSRCIGVSKMCIPEGIWYCPECSINRTLPRVTKGTTLKGGEVFGVDSYGQVFVGTCDHLLVLNALTSSVPGARYFNRNSIIPVLQALQLNEQHVAMYSDICKGILEYWEIPYNLVYFRQTSEVGSEMEKEDSKWCMQSPNILVKEGNHNVVDIRRGDVASSGSESCLENMDPVTQSDNAQERVFEFASKQTGAPLKTGVVNQEGVAYDLYSGSINQQPDSTNLGQQVEPSLADLATCTAGNSNATCRRYLNGTSMSSKFGFRYEAVNDRIFGGDYKNSASDFLYLGSSFKSHGYINNYLHGDFAASAAANLAVLASEENQTLESRSANRRKLMSSNIALQIKAFSAAAMRFFWPNTERKLVEVPRERCSWCHSCKAPPASKRGCYLNAAASSAIKGSLKMFAAFRPAKSGEGSLPGIATYVIFMEESLSGLTVGPFLSAAYRKHWRRQAEQASSYSALKLLLLELEENIRPIALSGDWFKFVDGWSAESSVTQSVASVAGSTQKRRPGRRGRKPSAVAEATGNDGQDVLTDFNWWRGGRISKLVFQKATLPRSLVKKAARQGGKNRIHGVYYVDDSENSKRSKRLVWRTAVEMSKNASQLAFQVRSLDSHVRWSDLVRPEQSIQDAKGPDSEASAFRNAFICDKKIMENETRYGIVFGIQKHLPSRVLKNIIDIEQSQDGQEKYWFPEMRIPLYLIKEYEVSAGETAIPSQTRPSNLEAELRRRQLKASRKDIFLYLVRKRDFMDICCCSSCQQDLLLGNAVECTTCKGLCHEQCTIKPTLNTNEQADITCKQCHHKKSVAQSGNNESPTSPLLLQGQELANAIAFDKGRKIVGGNRSSASVGSVQQSSERKRKLLSWGLIWKKNNRGGTGIEFRLKNILLKGNPDRDQSRPVCRLCQQPYNSELMYIRCEMCSCWYHADAVELVESKIFDLVGFKCCKCRRIRSPVCPYIDDHGRKLPGEKQQLVEAPKQENYTVKIKQLKEGDANPISLTEKVAHRAVNDPLLSSSRAEHYRVDNVKAEHEWDTTIVSELEPQKLPVRRFVKREGDALADNPVAIQLSTTFEGNMDATDEPIHVPQKLPVRRPVTCEMDLDNTCVEYPSPVEFTSFGGTNSNSADESMHGPRKLPVRRQTKREGDADYLVANNSSSSPIELSSTPEGNMSNSAVESLSPSLVWDVSVDGLEENMMFDYESLSLEDMEFEPQTYFSFNELLPSHDSDLVEGVQSSGDLAGTFENTSVIPEGETTGALYDQQTGTIPLEGTPEIVACKMCSHAQPWPDLSCQMCGIRMHSHCSPWEDSSLEGSWRCGSCRDWQ